DAVSPKLVFEFCQPSRPKNCRTLDGERSRQPSSKNRLPARYQLSPLELDPPCSNSPALRPKLPPLTLNSVRFPSLPSLVCSESAPPSVFSPNKGLDPGISATSEIAIR